MNSEEMESIVMGSVGTAARSAIVAHITAGNIPTDRDLSPQEWREAMELVDATATEIVMLKLLLGIVLPASPQFVADDVNSFAREMGMYSLRQGFLELTNKMPVEEAIHTWYGRNPNLAPFTVSSAGERDMTGYWEATTQVEKWMKDNPDIVADYPLGASLWAPKAEDAPWNAAAYRYIKRLGLNPTVTAGEYLKKMTVSQGTVIYRILRDQHEDELARIAALPGTAEDKKALKDTADLTWARARQHIYGTFPGLEETVTEFGGTPSIDTIIDDYEGATRLVAERGDKKAQGVLGLFDTYRQAKSWQDTALRGDPGYDDAMEDMRLRWKSMVLTWQDQFPDDVAVQRILKVLSRGLGYQIEELR
jgi:hypothetical protein